MGSCAGSLGHESAVAVNIYIYIYMVVVTGIAHGMVEATEREWRSGLSLGSIGHSYGNISNYRTKLLSSSKPCINEPSRPKEKRHWLSHMGTDRSTAECQEAD